MPSPNDLQMFFRLRGGLDGVSNTVRVCQRNSDEINSLMSSGLICRSYQSSARQINGFHDEFFINDYTLYYSLYGIILFLKQSYI